MTRKRLSDAFSDYVLDHRFFGTLLLLARRTSDVLGVAPQGLYFEVAADLGDVPRHISASVAWVLFQYREDCRRPLLIAFLVSEAGRTGVRSVVAFDRKLCRRLSAEISGIHVVFSDRYYSGWEESLRGGRPRGFDGESWETQLQKIAEQYRPKNL